MVLTPWRILDCDQIHGEYFITGASDISVIHGKYIIIGASDISVIHVEYIIIGAYGQGWGKINYEFHEIFKLGRYL